MKSIFINFFLFMIMAGFIYGQSLPVRSEQMLPILDWTKFNYAPEIVVYETMIAVASTMSEDAIMKNGGDDFMAVVNQEAGKRLKGIDIEKAFVFDNRFYKWKDPLKYHEVAFFWKTTRNWYGGKGEEYGFTGLTFDKHWRIYTQDEFAYLIECCIKDIIPWQSQRGRLAQERHVGVIPAPQLPQGGLPFKLSVFQQFKWLIGTFRSVASIRHKKTSGTGPISLEETGDWMTLGLPNGRKMLLRKVPAGIFVSGSPADEVGHVSQSELAEKVNSRERDLRMSHRGFYHLEDRVLHVIKIDKPFWIGKFEVQDSEFRNSGYDRELPVSAMSWDDAMAYCTCLNGLYADMLPKGYKFSLPLEEQWEYACRAGTTTALNDGTNLPKDPTEKSSIDTLGWYEKNTGRTSKPSGLLHSNAWGLYDMHGNLDEWCYDVAHSQSMLPGYPLGTLGNDWGWHGDGHVMRGGGIEGVEHPGEAIYCRSASRATAIGCISDYNGFRLALIPEELTPFPPSPFAVQQVAMRKITPARQGSLVFRLGFGISLEMENIPAGDFLMGSPEDEIGRLDQQYWQSVQGISSEKAEQFFQHTNEEQRKVSIKRDFWLGRFVVTRAQYAAVTGANLFLLWNPERPMAQIRWEEAVAFCGQLNELCKNQLPKGYRFAIPTEEQWEYACRAGTTTALNSGKNLTQGDFFCPNLAEVAWFQMNGDEQRREVGRLEPNAWGLYDMHGNVWEWCVCTTPVDDSPLSKRILRGGSWYEPPRFCRSSMRRWLDEDRGGPDIGFRVALVPVDSNDSPKKKR